MADNNKGDNNKAVADDKKKNKKNKPVNKPVELPEYVKYRAAKWDEFKALREKEAAKREAAGNAKIVVTLPDGKQIDGEAYVTTPMDIAKGIAAGLAQSVLVAKVNDKTWDLNRPMEGDCKLQLCKFDDPDGEYTFWHSSAHILGQALELYYKDARLCIGPPCEDGGFYYDVHLDEQTCSTDDFKGLEALIKKIQKERQPFERLELEKAEALSMFKNNKFKLEIISNKVPDGERCTAYRCGPLIDLCRGPHVPNTKVISQMIVHKNSSSYWLANANNATLQRVYGMSFPDKKRMKEWKELLKAAAERDHRKVGAEQELFFFHQLSPGSCFFLPHGTRIYNALQDFIRTEYRKRGYQEVVTPNVFNVDLWKTSGHYANYKDNMFTFDCENQEYGMKPMNCPGHCLLFAHRLRSYRELPFRVADFGVLHRNELSGALTGLTRVRRFQQDDAHIFCRQDQIEQEVHGVLDMLRFVYGVFGFTYELQLSTRPEKYLGEIAMWDRAEEALARCLNKSGLPWTINPADGAFYGPKIDIQLKDALNRKHQCATIQLDFQLPLRFELEYRTEEGFERPVIIHRAILGSVERMFAVLLEHTGGKWPLWLSPRQVKVVPTRADAFEYAEVCQQRLADAGFYVDVDLSKKQFPKKVRTAEKEKYNYIIVVGDKEADAGTVNVRADKLEMSLDAFIERLSKEKAEYK